MIAPTDPRAYSWPDLDTDDLLHRLAHLSLHAGGGDGRVGLAVMWRAVIGEAS